MTAPYPEVSGSYQEGPVEVTVLSYAIDGITVASLKSLKGLVMNDILRK